MDFPPLAFLGLTVTVVFWEGGWNSWMVALKIAGAAWAREERGSPPPPTHSKERTRWRAPESKVGKESVQ